MKEWRDYVQLTNDSAKGTGGPPRLRDFIALKLADNGLVIALLGLVVLFGSYGLFGQRDADQRAWALDAAKLCLGVFLGLFAGRRR